MNFFYQVHRAQQVGLACGRCASAHVDATNGRCITENNGAAGTCFQVGVVPYANARDVSDVVVHDWCDCLSSSCAFSSAGLLTCNYSGKGFYSAMEQEGGQTKYSSCRSIHPGSSLPLSNAPINGASGSCAGSYIALCMDVVDFSCLSSFTLSVTSSMSSASGVCPRCAA